MTFSLMFYDPRVGTDPLSDAIKAVKADIVPHNYIIHQATSHRSFLIFRDDLLLKGVYRKVSRSRVLYGPVMGLCVYTLFYEIVAQW